MLTFKLIRIVQSLFLPYVLYFHLYSHTFQYMSALISHFTGNIEINER